MSCARSIIGLPSLHQKIDDEPICISQTAFDHHLSDKCFRLLVREYRKKNVNCALFLDLKKAFDTVDHEILIRKMQVYGIKNIKVQWFRSYLKNCQQYCFFNGNKLSSRPVTSGIPQGSCLGPLLFILYLDDFETCLKFSKANLYADDTEVSLSSNEIGDLIQNFQTELENISEWLRIDKLSIHPEKTEFVVIDHPRRKASY